MKDEILTVKSNEIVSADALMMTLEGDFSEVAVPGQFLDVLVPGSFLRRPISILDMDEHQVKIIYKVVGAGTEALAEKAPGDTLDVLLPLGNGFDISKVSEKSLLVGGGIGTPPVFFLAKKMKEKGLEPKVVLGFRTPEDVLPLDMFSEIGVSPVVAVEETGSRREYDADEDAGSQEDDAEEDASNSPSGRPGAPSAFAEGLVTDIMKNVRDAGFSYENVFCCGPKPMLRAVYDISPSGEFSFEERMGCGFGACMGCSIRTKNGPKRVCKDGPVFDKEEIIWEEE